MCGGGSSPDAPAAPVLPPSPPSQPNQAASTAAKNKKDELRRRKLKQKYGQGGGGPLASEADVTSNQLLGI